MAKISQLPLLSTTSGNETLVVLKDGVTQRAPLDALAGGATARDAFAPLMQILGRDALGRITYSNGVRQVARPKLIVAELGNSLSNADGASSIDLSPGMQLVKKLRVRLPNYDIELDRYAVNGSWVSQYEARIDSFTRKPHIVVVVGGSNDAIANIFMGYQGFVGDGNTYGGFEAALENVFRKLRNLGCVVVNCTAPLWHPTRSLERGRMTVTPEVLMTWPVTSLIAFYLRIVFTKADQRISAYAVDLTGKYVPFDLFNQYANGLLTVGSWLLEFNPNSGTTGKQHQALEFGPDGSWVRVDGTITADKDDGVTSIRQCNFDNQTQVMPPLLAGDGVEGAIVQRDMGNGILVDVPLRLWEINRVSRRVASRNNIPTVDWQASMGRLIFSPADFDRLFTTSKPVPTADDIHPGDEGYLVLDGPLDRLADDMVHGVAPSLIYGPTSANDNGPGDGGGEVDARITAAQTTANSARTEAGTASATAGEALTTSGQALNTAVAARSDAGEAKATAEEALSGLADKAPVASPAFIGVPTAPTAAPGTMTGQLATTYFVAAALNAFVDGAPGAMDTFKELAAAMGNDPNFAATIINQLAGKQPLLGFTPYNASNPAGYISGIDAAMIAAALGYTPAPAISFAQQILTTTAPAVASASYAVLPGVNDLSVKAKAGDLIEIGLHGRPGDATNGTVLFNAYTVVGSTETDLVPGAGYLPAWVVQYSTDAAFNYFYRYTVKPGDIDPSSGMVKVRLKARVTSGIRSFYGEPTRPFVWELTNLGRTSA